MNAFIISFYIIPTNNQRKRHLTDFIEMRPPSLFLFSINVFNNHEYIALTNELKSNGDFFLTKLFQCQFYSVLVDLKLFGKRR